MKITLKNTDSIWGIFHPIEHEQCLMFLNSDHPEGEIDEKTLPEWAKHMVINSVIAGYVETDVELKMKTTENKKTKKKVSKKASKKTSKKKTSKKKTVRRYK